MRMHEGFGTGRDAAMFGRKMRPPTKEQHRAGADFRIHAQRDEMAEGATEQLIRRTEFSPGGRIGRHVSGSSPTASRQTPRSNPRQSAPRPSARLGVDSASRSSAREAHDLVPAREILALGLAQSRHGNLTIERAGAP